MKSAICVKCGRVHNLPNDAKVTVLCCGAAKRGHDGKVVYPTRRCLGRLKWSN